MWPLLIAAAALGIAGCASSTRQEDTEGADDTDSLPDQDGDGYSDANDCAPADASLQVLISGYKDQDRDGYTSGDLIEECVSENGQSSPYYTAVKSNPEDCDDANAEINPGQSEVLDNEVDENCDGLIETTPPVDVCEGVTGIAFNESPVIINMEEAKQSKTGLDIAVADFNGDGVSDIAIGTEMYGFLVGKVYGYKGGEGTFLDTPGTEITAHEKADFIMTSTDDSMPSIGFALAPYDVDKDGTQDLVTNADSHLVVIKDPFSTPYIDLAKVDFDAQTVPPEYSNLNFVYGVSMGDIENLGDINGSGNDSLMIYQSSGGICDTLEFPNMTSGFHDGSSWDQRKFKIAYIEERLCEPHGTASADLDGDGINEFILGGSASESFNGQAGHGRIFKGGTIPEGDFKVPKIGAGCGGSDVECFTFTGDQKQSYAGYLLQAGNLDGDDQNDLVISAKSEDGEHVDSGAVHVLWGAELSESWGSTLGNGEDIKVSYGDKGDSAVNLADLRTTVSIYGDSYDAKLGYGGLATYYDEECQLGVLAIGTVGYGETLDGRVYAIQDSAWINDEDGKITATEGEGIQVFKGPSDGQLGFDVILADVTGDGVADLITTARAFDNSRGQVRVYEGYRVQEE